MNVKKTKSSKKIVLKITMSMTTVDEEIFMNLLQMAMIDRKDFNKPMDAATRAMRHSAALAACLWVMFKEQKQRVYLQGIWS